ncbi:MAG: hypothetical protein U0531_15990 [Dehalococcoidia bacterium]
MNLLRMTIVDPNGTISFVADAEALAALTAACSRNPRTVDDLLTSSDLNYGGLRDRVMNGLAMFDERNTPGNLAAFHQALAYCAPHELPPFRVLDDATREASLRPVKAGAVLFNLKQKRIVQIQNTYREITRNGRAPIFDGETHTGRMFTYRLPREWAIVP